MCKVKMVVDDGRNESDGTLSTCRPCGCGSKRNFLSDDLQDWGAIEKSWHIVRIRIV